jgi:hypothetical protein
MWSMTIYGIHIYISLNFSFGMYLMIIGLVMSLLNYISLLVFRSKITNEYSRSNERFVNTMYITNY